MNIRSKFIAIAGSALLLASSLTMGSAAESDTGNASVKITGGVYAVEIGDGLFGERPYSLTNETYSNAGTMVVKVDDMRGNASGWNVNLKAGEFIPTADTLQANPNAANFPVTGNLTLAGGASTLRSGITQPQATLPAAGKTVNVTGSDQSVWTAADDTGDGRFDMTLTGTLTIPAGTLVGDYSSTVTVSLTAAP